MSTNDENLVEWAKRFAERYKLKIEQNKLKSKSGWPHRAEDLDDIRHQNVEEFLDEQKED